MGKIDLRYQIIGKPSFAHWSHSQLIILISELLSTRKSQLHLVWPVSFWHHLLVLRPVYKCNQSKSGSSDIIPLAKRIQWNQSKVEWVESQPIVTVSTVQSLTWAVFNSEGFWFARTFVNISNKTQILQVLLTKIWHKTNALSPSFHLYLNNFPLHGIFTFSIWRRPLFKKTTS